jgi:hypothetical protein
MGFFVTYGRDETAYKISVGKRERKRQLGKPRNRWKKI